MNDSCDTENDLEMIIRTSPVEPVSGYYYVLAAQGEPTGSVFVTICDGIEQTAVIVAAEPDLAPGPYRRGPYRLLRLRVSRPFEAPGFLAAACAALASERCNVLIYSTFSFDYLLVLDCDFAKAFDTLRRRGFGEDISIAGVQA